MWHCAWSSYHEEFCDHLKVIGEMDQSAENLLTYPIETWPRLVDEPIVKRFKGSSSINTTIVLEPDVDFPSSFSSDEPDPLLRPMSFSEANTRILERMKQPLATPTRRISFVGDSTGLSQPTNVPYQPPKLTWQNKDAVTGNKLRVTKEKMKTRKGNGKSQT
ncbi:hypothetical protein RND71_015464 [Anisodus tanguticus]|uniref:Uncharacterized protein n=1 Tax=Anisodus tanguticus TaxID=243964 RepID=A0AAE1VHQ1_9SOLA|nr:hypothetical protein RND71_015464 [Anisodus tanguticus]